MDEDEESMTWEWMPPLTSKLLARKASAQFADKSDGTKISEVQNLK